MSECKRRDCKGCKEAREEAEMLEQFERDIAPYEAELKQLREELEQKSKTIERLLAIGEKFQQERNQAETARDKLKANIPAREESAQNPAENTPVLPHGKDMQTSKPTSMSDGNYTPTIETEGSTTGGKEATTHEELMKDPEYVKELIECSLDSQRYISEKNAKLQAHAEKLAEALGKLVMAKNEKDQHGDTLVYRGLKIGTWEKASKALAEFEAFKKGMK